MKYKIIFLSAGLILLLTAVLFDINYLDYRKPVPYSQWENITLYDFRGFKKPFTALEGASKFAFIETSREVHYREKNAIEITTWFHPSRSYVYTNDIRSPDLLRHELYHFHIAEYISRLFRKEIATYNGAFTRTILDELTEKYRVMEGELQKQYDEDTDHSYVLQEQKKWETKVNEWLISLRSYSFPVVHLKN